MPAQLTVRRPHPAPAQQRTQRLLAQDPPEHERDARAQHRARQGRRQPGLRAEQRTGGEIEQRSRHEGDRADAVREAEEHDRGGPAAQLRRPAGGQQPLGFQEQHRRRGGQQHRYEQGEPGPGREQHPRAAQGEAVCGPGDGDGVEHSGRVTDTRV